MESQKKEQLLCKDSVAVKTLLKISAAFFTNIVNGFILFSALTPLIRLLRAGYIEGAGGSEVLKVLVGGVGLFVVAIGCLALFMISVEYYWYVSDLAVLLTRFTAFTGAEFLAVALIIFCYQVVFPFEMLILEWVAAGSSSFLGASLVIFSLVHRRRRPSGNRR